jgi:release factor family 10
MAPLSIPVKQQTFPLTGSELRGLAAFRSEKGDAVSLHFHRQEQTALSHPADHAALRMLLHELEERMGTGPMLDSLRELAEDWIEIGGKGKSLFACPSQGFIRVIDACPADSSVFVGHRFAITPLFPALRGARPYAILLVERGRARLFLVRGGTLTECVAPVANEAMNERPQDSRVGWSAHIEGHWLNTVAHYWKDLAEVTEGFCRFNQTAGLMIGFREDVRGEFLPHFSPWLRNAIVGTFVPASFEEPLAAVLAEATQVLAATQATEEARVLQLLAEENRDQGRSSTGISAAIEDMETGRAQTLLLSGQLRHDVFECVHCGHLHQHRPAACEVCRSNEVAPADLAEGLVRKALDTGAAIHLFSQEQMAPYDGVAVIRRYS